MGSVLEQEPGKKRSVDQKRRMYADLSRLDVWSYSSERRAGRARRTVDREAEKQALPAKKIPWYPADRRTGN